MPRFLRSVPRMGAARPAAPRANKYNATKMDCAFGHTHDSKREARRCNDLHLLARVGEITDLKHQPQFWFVIDGQQVKHPNGRRVGVTFDFTYVEGGKIVAEDSKGHRVRDWPLRRAIFEALFPEYEVRES